MHKKVSSFAKLTITDYIKIFAVIFFIWVLVFGCCFSIYALVSLPCGNDLIDEIHSPDNQYKVVVFHSGCGVNSTDFIKASILKSGQELSNSKIDIFRVNIFISDMREVGEIQVVWQDNRSIQIIYPPYTKELVQKIEFNYSNQIFTVFYQVKEK